MFADKARLFLFVPVPCLLPVHLLDCAQFEWFRAFNAILLVSNPRAKNSAETVCVVIPHTLGFVGPIAGCFDNDGCPRYFRDRLVECDQLLVNIDAKLWPEAKL